MPTCRGRRADAREHELLAIRRRIFDACRDVAPSPRGEFELPDAVGLARPARGPFRAVPARGPVLDLSRRGRHGRSRASPARSTSRAMTDAATLAGHLVAAGLDEAERAAKARLFERVLDRWPAGCRTRLLPRAWWVPGRLEVFGTHTDYAGGRTLVARGPARVRVPRGASPRRRIRAVDRTTPGPGTEDRHRRGVRRDLAGAIRRALPRLAALRRGRPPHGSRAIFPAARSAPTSCSPAICRAPPGMSSSSALVVGIAIGAVARRAAPRTPRVAGRTSARLSTKLAICALRRERPRRSARSPATRASARTAAARITRRCSRAPPAPAASSRSCRCGSSRLSRCRRRGRSSWPRAASDRTRPGSERGAYNRLSDGTRGAARFVESPRRRRADSLGAALAIV